MELFRIKTWGKDNNDAVVYYNQTMVLTTPTRWRHSAWEYHDLQQIEKP